MVYRISAASTHDFFLNISIIRFPISSFGECTHLNGVRMVRMRGHGQYNQGCQVADNHVHSAQTQKKFLHSSGVVYV